MRIDTLGGLNRNDFIGLGIGANANKAIRICRERQNAEGIYRDIGTVNLGISSSTFLGSELGEALKAAGLNTVLHLEELNVSGVLDEKRLDCICEQVNSLSPMWIEQDLGIWAASQLKLGAHMLSPLLTEEGLDTTILNIRNIIDATGTPFLAENPPIYMNIGNIDLLEYMSRLAEATGCGLVLDLGHLIGYCVATDREPLAYLNQWNGIDHVIEIHIAGYELYQSANRFIWLDRHSVPIPEFGIELLRHAFECATHLKVVTLEQDGATTEIEQKNIASVGLALGLRR